MSIPPPSSSAISVAEGKYAILAELGRGGMATAYVASMSGPGGFNKLVVVKRLRPSLAAEPEFLSMFLEEARLSARIDHPNVVHTTEVGFDGKHHYIAMEYLDGQSFESISRRLLKRMKAEQGDAAATELGGESAIPLKFQLHVISQILLGLDCAHELENFDGTALNVVHRDVSPHNIVITYDGHVKLLDFGIAKAADSSGDTRTGVMKGKCAYMPAEQFGGRQIDRRADIFAVGVILWQALTGRRLWRGMSDAEIFQKVAAGDIKPPSSFRPDVLEPLDAICMKALAHKPEDRFATAADFQLALEEVIGSHPELRTTARELGKFVADVFEEDRAKMKAIIEAQLGKASTSLRSMSIPVIGGTQSHSGVLDGSVPTSGPSSTLSLPQASGPNLRLVAAAAAAALAVAVLVGVTVSQVRSSRAATGAQAAPSSASPVNPLMTTSADTSGSTAVTAVLHVRSTPASAQLLFDGAPLDGNPATSVFPRDGLSHRIAAEAPGYVSKSELVTLDSADIKLDLALDPVSPSPAAPRAAAPRSYTAPPARRPQADTAPPAPAPAGATPPSAATPAAPPLQPRGPQLDKADPWAPAAAH